MKYISTRGQSEPLSFEEVLLAGLAPDGGLYVPETLPRFTLEQIERFRQLPYAELAYEVMYPFVEGEIPEEAFRDMINETYQTFDHPAVAPLVQLGPNEWVMELFHGPTLAFKDFALQLLGRLLDYVLEKRNKKVVIIGATSGDTGSAAIEGCRHCKHVDIFILHPYQRVSEVQRRQMTTVIGDNIHNLAVKGNFDDCQRIVKESFSDQGFLQGKTTLVAVNSINWARIMAQIVYYFHAALSLGGPHRSVAFSVPTGNFGDVFAGYLARNMGLPINQLVVATNSNDILHRFISKNHYQVTGIHHTLSPSMDIAVSSNFERLLFDLFGRNGAMLADQMVALHQTSGGSIEPSRWQAAREVFDSCAVDDEMTCETIRDVYERTGMILDPHTAIGVKAASTMRRDSCVPIVTLATAHPAKFPEAVKKAGVPEEPALPLSMKDLFERPESYTVVENSLASVQDQVLKNVRI